jgi:hypothetical protein
VAVEDVVAEDDGYAATVDEVTADDEGFGYATRRRLLGIGERNPQTPNVSQQRPVQGDCRR